jgi:CheY-like chemotaxis protein
MKAISVLLVEDNPADADLTRETLEAGKLHIDLSVAIDGEQALQMLRSDRAMPDLILLDLNLPRKGGRQILMEIRADARLRHIPVVILTSSDAEKDVAQSYASGANCYITKPVDLWGFQRIVAAVEDFWFGVVKLPASGSVSPEPVAPAEGAERAHC